VLQKRFEQSEEPEGAAGSRGNGAGGMLAAAETARSASESSAKAEGKDDEKISIFWRVFGGTILSIAALVVITVYNSISSSIAELRNELNRERDARAELVKKQDFDARASNQSERIRALDGLKAEFEGLRERVSAAVAAVEAQKKDTAAGLDGVRKEVCSTADVIKKDAAALEVLKERVAALEGVKKDIAGIDLLKEKLAATATDLKSMRDDVAKLQQEAERSRASDVERKTGRDAQFKQIEETLKELQKGLQTCREKLARMEGSQPVTPARGTFIPFDLPVPPGESKGAGNPAEGGTGKPGKPGPTPPKPGPDDEDD
jgi:myosin heavy subunit